MPCSGILVLMLPLQDPAARKYAEWTGRACEADGIRYELRTVTEYDLEEQLYLANEDPEVHGIMTFFPVFGTTALVKHAQLRQLGGRADLGLWINCRSPSPGFFPSFFGGSMDDYLRDSVSYKKDVEGLSFTYRFNLYRNIRFMDNEPEQRKLKCLLPCTALSVVKILESVGAYDARYSHALHELMQ